MKLKVLSHADLDGIGAVINIWNAVRSKKDFEYKLTGYGSLTKNIQSLAKEKAKMIWITDINFNRDQINMLTSIPSDVSVVYIDHHNYNYDVSAELKHIKAHHVTARVDKRYCGALNTFLFLSNLSKDKPSFWNENKQKLVELNKYIDLYDRWQKKHPLFFEKALPLNDLFWEYGYEKFFLKFRDGYKLDAEDLEVIDKRDKERKLYITESYEEYSIICKETNALYILNPNPEFTNCFTLYYPEFDFYVLLKEASTTEYSFSIRINDENEFSMMDVIAELEKTGIDMLAGGHTKSGGITIARHDRDKFMDSINEVFGEMLNARPDINKD